MNKVEEKENKSKKKLKSLIFSIDFNNEKLSLFIELINLISLIILKILKIQKLYKFLLFSLNNLIIKFIYKNVK